MRRLGHTAAFAARDGSILIKGNIEMTAGVVFELTAVVGRMLCGDYIVIILLQKSEKKNAIFDTLFNFMSAPL